MKEWLKANTIEDVKKFYNEKYITHGPEAFAKRDWSFFFNTISLFFKNLEPTHSILDCGAGSGFFLDYIVRSMPVSHPYLCGIEISPEACHLFLERLKGRAYLFEGDYSQEWNNEGIRSFNFNSFDVVTCWGTIEHSFNIGDAFFKLCRFAKPGGLVMITVPLETEDCLAAIREELNPVNNERFATEEEWVSIFSQWLNPFHVSRVEGDLLMVFRKMVGA